MSRVALVLLVLLAAGVQGRSFLETITRAGPSTVPRRWVVGFNDDLQLCRGSEDDLADIAPVLLPASIFGDDPFDWTISAYGNRHSFITTEDGDVYACGTDFAGEGAFGDNTTAHESPAKIETVSNVIRTWTGTGNPNNWSAWLQEDPESGELTLKTAGSPSGVHGDPSYGSEAGTGKLIAAPVPTFPISGVDMIDMECVMGSCAVLGVAEDVNEGRASVWTWGDDASVGAGASVVTEWAAAPREFGHPVVGNKHELVWIKGMYNRYFVADSEGQLWSWGTEANCFNRGGSLGHWAALPTRTMSSPTILEDFRTNGTTFLNGQVEGAQCVTAAMDDEGKIWTFGGYQELWGTGNVTGVAGWEDNADYHEVTYFTDNDIKVAKLGAGSFALFAITDEGEVYSWGGMSSFNGADARVLGHGDIPANEESNGLPRKIEFFVKGTDVIGQVRGGDQHTVFVEELPIALPYLGWAIIGVGSLMVVATCYIAISADNGNGAKPFENKANLYQSVRQSFWGGGGDYYNDGASGFGGAPEEPQDFYNDEGPALGRADPYAAKTMVGGAGDVYTQQPRKPSGGSKRAAPGGSRKGSKGSKGSRGSRRGSKGSRRKGPGSDASPADFLPSTIDYKKVEKMAGMHKSYKVGKNLS